MIKKQRGSAAVLALVMLLFLSLAGGAWVLMHAQDNATALSDAKEQQAWYAAESGVKRAKAELENSNTDWKWLNTDKDKDFKDDGKFLALDPDKKTTDAKTAKYAVSITYPTSSSDTTPIYLDSDTGMVTTTGTTTYTITSVGKYMETTKVIKEKVAVKRNSEKDEDDSDIQTTPLLGVVNAGSIDVSSMGGPSNLLSGELYGNSITGQGNDSWNHFPFNEEDAGYTNTLFTHVPDSYFLTKEQAIADGAILYRDKYGGDPQIVFEKDKSYYIDNTSVFGQDGNPNNNSISLLNCTNAAGATIYVYDDMWAKLQNISGPTSNESTPVTIIVVNSSTATMNVNTTGRVRMLAASDLTFSGSKKYGYFMTMTNGSLQLIGQETKCVFACANQDVLVSGGNFTGQIMAKGTVTLKGLQVKLDATIYNDKAFWLKEWKE